MANDDNTDQAYEHREDFISNVFNNMLLYLV